MDGDKRVNSVYYYSGPEFDQYKMPAENGAVIMRIYDDDVVEFIFEDNEDSKKLLHVTLTYG